MTDYLGGSFGAAIIALTIIINAMMLGLTLKQMRATKAVQELQPKIAELQKKYAKDRQRLAQEQMRLYRESGMNPAGCMVPMIIQMPIWLALYQSIMLLLAVTPEGLLDLSRYLYPWSIVYSLLPLANDFLWLNLANPDMLLALLVGATMWLQQKMATPPAVDPKQEAQARMMLWMMPLMFAFFALSFPSGLALFWVISSVVRIVLQYYATGLGGLTPAVVKRPPASRDKRYVKYSTREQQSSADIKAEAADTTVEKTDQGLGYSTKPQKTRFLPGRDRAQHKKK